MPAKTTATKTSRTRQATARRKPNVLAAAAKDLAAEIPAIEAAQHAYNISTDPNVEAPGDDVVAFVAIPCHPSRLDGLPSCGCGGSRDSISFVVVSVEAHVEAVCSGCHQGVTIAEFDVYHAAATLNISRDAISGDFSTLFALHGFAKHFEAEVKKLSQRSGC